MDSEKIKLIILYSIFVIGLFSIGLYLNYKNDLKDNDKIETVGVIISKHSCFRGTTCIDFKYKAKGLYYIGTTSLSKLKKGELGRVNISDTFPVVYSYTRPKYCTIQIFGKDFEQISLGGTRIE